MVYNMYTQVAGRKRFILFPPEAADVLCTYPSIHPSARMSQINFNDPKSPELFAGFFSFQQFPKKKNVDRPFFFSKDLENYKHKK